MVLNGAHQDGQRQRVRKAVIKIGGIREERIYLGSYEIYRKFTGSSLTLERTTVHISDDTGRIAMVERRTVGTDAAPALLKRFIYSNHLRSASLELNDTAQIISYEEYHPFGTTSYQATNASINAVAKRYRYTGKERDEENGLYYHGARYYVPWLGRWCAVDALEGKYAGLSPYNYCFCNPVSWTDPSGNGPGDEDDLPKYKTYFLDSTSGRILGEIPNFVDPEAHANISLPDAGINLRVIAPADYEQIVNKGASLFYDETDPNPDYKFGASILVDSAKIEGDLNEIFNRNTRSDDRSYKEQLVLILFNKAENKITSEILPDNLNATYAASAYPAYTTSGRNFRDQVFTSRLPDEIAPVIESKGDIDPRRYDFLNSNQAYDLLVLALAHTHLLGPNDGIQLDQKNPGSTHSMGKQIGKVEESKEDLALYKSSGGMLNFIIETFKTKGQYQVKVSNKNPKNEKDVINLGNFADFNNVGKILNIIVQRYRYQ